MTYLNATVATCIHKSTMGRPAEALGPDSPFIKVCKSRRRPDFLAAVATQGTSSGLGFGVTFLGRRGLFVSPFAAQKAAALLREKSRFARFAARARSAWKLAVRSNNSCQVGDPQSVARAKPTALHFLAVQLLLLADVRVHSNYQFDCLSYK